MARIKGVTESEANDEVRQIFEDRRNVMALCQTLLRSLPLGRQSRKESRHSPKEFRNQDL